MNELTIQAPGRGEQSEPDIHSLDDDQEVALASYMNSLALELRGHYHDISGEEQTLEDALQKWLKLPQLSRRTRIRATLVTIMILD